MQQDNQNQDANSIKDSIMKELNLEGLDSEKQDEIIAKMGEVILKKIFIQTVEKLSDDDRVQFEKMLEEEKSSEEVEKFLGDKIPDFEEMTQKIVLELKEEMKKADQGVE